MLHGYRQWKNDVRRPFFFHRLQWKLTRAYVLVTVILVAAVQIGVYGFVMTSLLQSFRSPAFPPRIAEAMLDAAPQFAPHFKTSGAPGNFLPLLLAQFRFVGDYEFAWNNSHLVFGHNFQGSTDERTFLDERVRAIFLTDPAGQVLATFGSEPLQIGANVTEQLPAAAERLRLANNGVTDAQQLVAKSPEGFVLAAVPVFDESRQQVIGLFWAKVDVSINWDVVSGLMIELFGQIIWVSLFGLALGLAFGFFTARNLTHRLNHLAHAAGQWGQGNFNERAPELPHDELGGLGERLNQMAAELQKQMALQQQLATMEERNRLALELHDTVKQQLFACAMQISAAERLLQTNPTAAQRYLRESEALAKQMQEELTKVIQELLPANKSARALPQSWQAITADWTRQTGIPVVLQLNNNGHRYAPAIERALLRITQEALANIARHSAATQVELHFEDSPTHPAQLMIADNGRGFIATEQNGGLGLQSMRERAQSLPGGEFSIESLPQQGTRIIVRFHAPPHAEAINS